MNNVSTNPLQQVNSVDELIIFYQRRAEQHQDLKVGIEWERFGVYTDSLEVVPYLGEKGYLEILKFLHQEKGWTIEDIDAQGHIFTLYRNGSRTTVEGDGKPEISAAPFASLHDVYDEIRRHKGEIEEVSQKFGITWIPLGLQPFQGHEEIPLVPKRRYQLWDRIFTNDHEWMHTYMKALAGTHLNFGYTSEANLLRKTQVLLRISPLLAAMFANSPFDRGKVGKCLGMRRKKIFTDGPGQEKLMAGMLRSDFSLQKWIEWYIAQPLIIFPFDQEIIVPQGWTFRTWMEQGYAGKFPNFADFDAHLKTRWVDVRFRPSYLELRVFDTLPFPLLMSAAAFVKGLVFDRQGWEAVEKITTNWTEETLHQLHLRGCREGLATEIGGTSFVQIAQELLEVSAANLQKFARINAQGQDERIFLEPLKNMLRKGMSPAADLVSFTQGDATKIGEWVKIHEQ